MRKEARLLEHITERAPMGGQKRAVSVLPDLAGDDAKSVQSLEAGDAAQDRGLPAAGRSEQGGHASCGRGEASVERKGAEHAFERGPDRLAVVHARARANRFSTRIIDRMTAKANATMPPASRLASRQRIVSVKSKIAVDITR